MGFELESELVMSAGAILDRLSSQGNAEKRFLRFGMEAHCAVKGKAHESKTEAVFFPASFRMYREVDLAPLKEDPPRKPRNQCPW